MQRYFINEKSIKNNTIIIEGSDHHHIKNVMRMHPKEKIICLTNDSYEYLCEIESITNLTTLNILEKKKNNNELDAYVSIAQGLVKKNKCDEVLRRLVELGTNEYFNVSMDFSVTKANEDNSNYLIRRSQIVKEASEQSERGKLLNLKETMKFNQFLNYSKEFDVLICAYEEEGRNNNKNLLEISKSLSGKKVLCLVGPEGGISFKEVELLKNAGFKFVGLGKRILRTETAPLYLMSVLSFMIDNN